MLNNVAPSKDSESISCSYAAVVNHYDEDDNDDDDDDCSGN